MKTKRTESLSKNLLLRNVSLRWAHCLLARIFYVKADFCASLKRNLQFRFRPSPAIESFFLPGAEILEKNISGVGHATPRRASLIFAILSTSADGIASRTINITLRPIGIASRMINITLRPIRIASRTIGGVGIASRTINITLRPIGIASRQIADPTSSNHEMTSLSDAFHNLHFSKKTFVDTRLLDLTRAKCAGGRARFRHCPAKKKRGFPRLSAHFHQGKP